MCSDFQRFPKTFTLNHLSRAITLNIICKTTFLRENDIVDMPTVGFLLVQSDPGASGRDNFVWIMMLTKRHIFFLWEQNMYRLQNRSFFFFHVSRFAKR